MTTIVRQIVHPSEHSVRMFLWIYEYDFVRVNSTVRNGVAVAFSCLLLLTQSQMSGDVLG